MNHLHVRHAFTTIVSNVQQIDGNVRNVNLAMELDKCKIITTNIVALAQLQTAGIVPSTIKSVWNAKRALDSMNKAYVFNALRTVRNVFIKEIQQIKINKSVFTVSKGMEQMRKVYVKVALTKTAFFVKISGFVLFAKVDMG